MYQNNTNKQNYGLELNEDQLLNWRSLINLAIGNREFTVDEVTKFRDAFQKVLDEIGE